MKTGAGIPPRVALFPPSLLGASLHVFGDDLLGIILEWGHICSIHSKIVDARTHPNVHVIGAVQVALQVSGAHEERQRQASGVRGGGEELPPSLQVLFPGEFSGAVRVVQEQAHVHQVGCGASRAGCAGRAQRRTFAVRVQSVLAQEGRVLPTGRSLLRTQAFGIYVTRVFTTVRGLYTPIRQG